MQEREDAMLTKLSELAVTDEQRSESAETVEGLVTVLLGGLLVNWSIWGGSVAAGELLGLPDEVLKEVTLVLGEHQDLGLLDDAAEISDKLLTLSRELLRGT